ncbi:MAG: mechanosensitive ion channel [Salinarimonas sp.]|nr:mechanosensitive ion channel [Salinarimonas sp.]
MTIPAPTRIEPPDPQLITEFAADLAANLIDPFVIGQIVLIAVIGVIAFWIGRRFELRFERHARRIRDNISLLRLAVIIMRRMVMITLAALLWLAFAAIRALDPVFDPVFEPELISLAAALASAWVVISIVTRLIRNRLLGRIAAALAWGFVALRLTGLSGPLGAALDATALEIGGVRLSFLVALQAGLIVAAALWVAVVLGRVIEERLSRTEELTPSLRVLIGKLVRIGLIILATVIALTSIGIDLTALTVFSGALGVGIGFGLQKVVSNYLSGIIILADKSIKPGDTISLGDKVGWVRSIRARFVSIVTRDGVEFLIPNEDFITNRVINWSFSDNNVRMDTRFGVAYDSDPHQIRALAVEAAGRVARVQTQPAPVCHMLGFGDSSLDFVLRFWIADPRNGLTNVRGEVFLALWDAFREAGVTIPYPHRQVILQDQNLPD